MPVHSAKSPVNVLVVDDSAVVRQVMTTILSQEVNLQVSVAADPLIAMEKMRRERPDVIVLDLEMPRMHGLTFLHHIMSHDPIPVVVCSGTTENGDATAISALEAGAVAVIGKPKIGVRDFLYESAVMLIDTVVSAAHARLRSRGKAAPVRACPNPVLPSNSARAYPRSDSRKVIAIGASTGGPEAISSILEQLDPDCPPLVIVQHMPEAFTAAYARRLDGLCRIHVKEAEHGDRACSGLALIAPGNRHMSIRKGDRSYFVSLSDDALVNRHRPSVDVLFRSVAKTAERNGLGVLLTGMGNDGADGLLQMRRSGAYTIAQDEDSSVVFGMPREAIALGAATRVVPLNSIVAAIQGWTSSQLPSGQ